MSNQDGDAKSNLYNCAEMIKIYAKQYWNKDISAEEYANLCERELEYASKRIEAAVLGAQIEGAQAYNRTLVDNLCKPTYMNDDGERWTVYKSEWVSEAIFEANRVNIHQREELSNA